MNGKRLTTQQVDRIVYLYVDKGLSAYEVARRIGITNHTVARVLKRRGIYVRPPAESYDNMRGPRPLPEELVKEITELWNSGVTVTKIAKQLHRSYKTVSRALRDQGFYVGNRIQIMPYDLFRLYWIERLSTRGVGERLGISRPTIIKNMQEYGIVRRRRGGVGGGGKRRKEIPSESVSRILELYKTYGIKAVAKITGYTKYIVKSVLVDNEVEIRRRSQARPKRLRGRWLQRLRIIARWKEGSDVHTIADEFDMKLGNVRAIIGRWYRKLERAED